MSRRFKWSGAALAAMSQHLQRRGAGVLQAIAWCAYMESNFWPAGGDRLVCRVPPVTFLMLGPDHGEITGIGDLLTGEVVYEGEVCSRIGSREPCRGGSSEGPTYTT